MLYSVPKNMKSHYKDIARQLVEENPGKSMNVIFGGGRDFLVSFFSFFRIFLIKFMLIIDFWILPHVIK